MQAHTDIRGHTLSTTSPAAAEAFNNGVHSYVRWRTETFPQLDVAIAADGNFALAKLAKGWILHSGRSAAARPVIEGLLHDAAPLIDGADTRESAYFLGLKAALNGHGIEAGTTMEAMLDRHPTDLFAHRLVQLELFWNGRIAWLRDIAERATPHWNDNLADYGGFLSIRAFAAEESGDYAIAERYGREALEIDPTDCWGSHTMAHVFTMQGRIDEGISWFEGMSGNWVESNQMKHHLWWHFCLLLLERGEYDRTLDLLTSQVRNPDSPLVKAAPAAPIDIQNVASLLMRLRLLGVDVGERWNILADICAGRVDDHRSPFGNAHDMMVLAATDQLATAHRSLDGMRDYAATADGSLAAAYRTVGIPICEAILAHFKGEFGRVIELISPVRHDLPLIGASHAQRDIFYQILIDAARREGRTDLIRLFLADIARMGFDLADHRVFYRDKATPATGTDGRSTV